MDGGSSHRTGCADQNHPEVKKRKQAKSLSEEALQITENRSEKQKRREKI